MKYGDYFEHISTGWVYILAECEMGIDGVRGYNLINVVTGKSYGFGGGFGGINPEDAFGGMSYGFKPVKGMFIKGQ